jgi:hypothetical protein
LNRLLVQADQWTLLINRTGTDINNAFHALDKLPVDPSNAPALLLPRFQVVLPPKRITASRSDTVEAIIAQIRK